MAESTIKTQVMGTDLAPYPVRCIQDRVIVSGSNAKERIAAYIQHIETGDMYTTFNTVLIGNGNHMFTGYVYPDKSYGSGIYHDYENFLIFWRRYSGADRFYSINTTDF